jgi:hypothetical protein
LIFASGGPAGGQTFEKFDKRAIKEIDRPVEHPNPFVQIFKIWSPGRAAGGMIIFKINRNKTR